jgi:hypothetical protein
MPDPDTGEPTAADVAAYSQGRLSQDDSRTTLLLAGALAAARAYCGWHVIPECEETVTVDGPGSPLLVLPTLRLVDLTQLAEGGVQLDVDSVEWSGRGLVRKPGHGCWTAKYRGITATMTHGFTSAPDFIAAVLAAVDRVGCGGGETIGPFKFPDAAVASGSSFSTAEKAILDLYRLEPTP